jgi:hypothetical protein
VYKWTRAEITEALFMLQEENDELKTKIKYLEKVIEYEKSLKKWRPYNDE